MEKKRNWWDDNISDWKGYIRSYGEGVGFPSREWVSDHVSPEQSILDVGCGGGIEYENLIIKRPDIEYVGVDFSTEAIKACHELFPEANFQVGDARDLKDFKDLSFDTVLIRHCLDHVDDWESALRAAYRVAKKEIVIVLWTGLKEEEGSEHYLDEKGDDGFYRLFSWPKLRAWIEEELKPTSLERTTVSAKDVPGREYRTDDVICITK